MSVLKWYIWRTQCRKWHSDARWQLFRQASIKGVSMNNQTQISSCKKEVDAVRKSHTVA